MTSTVRPEPEIRAAQLSSDDLTAGPRQERAGERQRCRDHTRAYGEDAPQIRDWRWPS
jgi:hypothetical protein